LSAPSEEGVAVDADVVDDDDVVVHGIDLAVIHAIRVADDSAIEVAIHLEIHLDFEFHPNFEIDVDWEEKEEEKEEEEEEIGRRHRRPRLDVVERKASCAIFLCRRRRRFRLDSRLDTFWIRIFPNASR